MSNYRLTLDADDEPVPPLVYLRMDDDPELCQGEVSKQCIANMGSTDTAANVLIGAMPSVRNEIKVYDPVGWMSPSTPEKVCPRRVPMLGLWRGPRRQ